MEIQVTLGYNLKNGHPVDRFIITPGEETKTAEIAEKINPFKVSDTSHTCDNDSITWQEFLEHHGRTSIVYEIPRKYSDAFNLYLKMVRMVFFTK